MNEQAGKTILFNKSTLLNLKAELLKKKEEVQEKKRLPQHKIEYFKPPPSRPSDSDEKATKPKKTFKDSLQAIETEEIEAYKKTRSMLEKKAELYNHLSNPVGESQLGSKYLVDFASKKQDEHVDPRTVSPVPEYDDNKVEDDDSDWTEFTDCLGRTRKCLKTDLDLYKEKDADLMSTITKGQDQSGVIDNEPPPSIKPYLVQKTNDYLQTLRAKWELKEQELLAKEKDVHYQDLLFDEARMHGVSYFSFSTDENERQKQMEELLKIREETLRAQKDTEEKRRQREDLVASRLKAVKARERLRAGLPPEDPEENQKDFNTCLLEFLNKQKKEAEIRANEEEQKIKDQIEKERQKLREAYVREWDRGKTGVDDKPKFKEMSQEEYVEQQRSKRIDEFAPYQSASSSKSLFTFDNRGRKATDEPEPAKTWASVRPKANTHPPPVIDYIDDSKGLYFSSSKNAANSKFHKEIDIPADARPKAKTPPPPVISYMDIQNISTDRSSNSDTIDGQNFSTAKSTQANMKYRNYFVKEQEPTPIENELSDDDNEVHIPVKRKYDSNCTEIPPPPTYDYYGPVSKHSRCQKPFESDIREAYAQGKKSLETRESDRRLPEHYDFTFD